MPVDPQMIEFEKYEGEEAIFQPYRTTEIGQHFGANTRERLSELEQIAIEEVTIQIPFNSEDKYMDGRCLYALEQAVLEKATIYEARYASMHKDEDPAKKARRRSVNTDEEPATADVSCTARFYK